MPYLPTGSTSVGRASALNIGSAPAMGFRGSPGWRPSLSRSSWQSAQGQASRRKTKLNALRWPSFHSMSMPVPAVLLTLTDLGSATSSIMRRPSAVFFARANYLVSQKIRYSIPSCYDWGSANSCRTPASEDGENSAKSYRGFHHGRRTSRPHHGEHRTRQGQNHRCHGDGPACGRQRLEGPDAAIPQRLLALRRTRCRQGLRRQFRDEADGTRLRESWRSGN